MRATELDRKLDDGEDMGDQVDWSRVKRPNTQMQDRFTLRRQTDVEGPNDDIRAK